ncbi:RluA family pseudouridine synthase [Aureispira]|nr:RluA family pseudouridine synthase [Aureispira sp.]
MAKRQYKVLFEDEHLLIVEKESGFLTIPDRYRPYIPNLHNSLQLDYGEIYIVHRLDKGTSGLVCFAKTKEVHRLLNIQFEKREPVKQYYAIVKGIPFYMEGTIDAGLTPNKEGGMHIDIKRGKPSVTDYKVIEYFRSFSLIEATILTGRTHQIRVHLKHLGYPLAVDGAYAQKEALYLSEIKRRKFNLKKDTEERPLISRVPLHAYHLSFSHPITDEKISVESELPKDMKALLNQLRKWDKK